MAKQMPPTMTDLAQPVARRWFGWSAQRFLRWLDYLFILRPTLFFPVWTVFGAGLVVAYVRLGRPPWTRWLSAEAALNGLALTLLMGSAFVLNQIVDIPTDRRNRKLFLLADGHVSLAVAVFEAAVLFLASLSMAFAAGLQSGVLFVVIYFVTAVGYSLRPFSWKDRPLAGLLANMLGASLIFTAGFTALSAPLAAALWKSLPYAAAVGAVFLYTTLPDEPGDREIGKRTFVVAFGPRWTIRAGTALEMLSGILAFALRDPVIFVPALAAAPFFLYASLRPRMENVVRAIKFPILFLALSVCYFFPPYIVLLVVTYLFSKWYYWQRFGLRYPSLDAG